MLIEMYERPVKISKAPEGKKCSDCGADASAEVKEADGKVWHWCLDCDVGE